ncbi:MAG: HAD hydrolase-like protein, partial [Thermoplasmatota archaeon]
MMKENEDLILIFDLDGTIFRTKETIFPAVKEVLKDLGCEDEIENQVSSLIGEKTSEFCEKLKPDDIEMDRFIEMLWEKEKEFIDKKGSLYEGVSDLLEELRSRDINMVLCSNANRDYIEYVLDGFGLKDYFISIYSGSNFDNKINAVKSIVERFDRNPAVLIGDREIDKNAAGQNDVIFLAALYGYGRGEIEDVYFTVESPKEIIGHVNRLEIFSAIENDFKALDEYKINTIGVNDIDNSGKSVFASSLSEYLKARGYRSRVISIDDFHNPRQIRREGQNPVDAYYENAFDIGRL